MNTNEVVREVNGNPFSFYWTYAKLKTTIATFARGHKKMFVLLFSLLAFTAFMFRWFIQPCALALRIYGFEIVLATGLLCGFWGAMKSKMRMGAYVVALMVSALIVWPHEYVTLWWRHAFLDKKDSGLLETAHERIQPLNSVRASINGSFNNENYQFGEPFFVRGANGSYRWTCGREPTGGILSYVGGVDEVMDVSATDPSPNYARMDSHISAHFTVGDHLHLGKNSKICAIRSLGPLLFFSCVPDKLRYVEETKGHHVQIVPLIKYSGWVYPHKDFGGVIIIRQSEGGLGHFFKTMLFGDGEYVAPEDIDKYPFLKGQNLVPYEVSRYIAESFSFRNGILENSPWNNNGAVRIPDVHGDANNQPFAVCFKQDNGEEKIFQWFGMQPADRKMGGQTMSLLVPGDGIGPVLVYDNIANHDNMVSVSSVNVKEADEHIDWSHTQPAERRPFIRTILGKKRIMAVTALVTLTKNISDILGKGEEVTPEDYLAGGAPKMVLTEPHIPKSIRVSDDNPEMWVKEAEREFGPYWKQTDSK